MEDEKTVHDDVQEAIAELSEPEVTEEVTEDEQVVEASEEETPDAPSEEETEEEATEEVEPEEEPLPAPVSLTAEEREAWKELPRPAQEILTRREREWEQKHNSTMSDVAPLRRIVDTHASYFDKIGVTPDVAINFLVGADQQLRWGTPQQKLGVMQQIAQQYGVDFNPQTQEVDPDMQAAIGPYAERLHQLERQAQERELADRRAQEAQAQQTANKFYEWLNTTSDVEAQHAATVMPEFEALLNVELQAQRKPDVEGLKALYKKAARLVPSAWDAIVASQAKPAPKPNGARRTVRKSSSATGSAVKVAHSTQQDENRTVEQDVRAAFAEAREASA